MKTDDGHLPPHLPRSEHHVDHAAAVALYFMYYNFARIHQTLRCSPAMAAGVDNRLWEVKDIVAMIEGSV